MLQARLELAEVAGVDANQPSPAVEDARQVAGLAAFDQRFHSYFVGLTEQSRQFLQLQTLRNEQHGIRPRGSCFKKLIAVENEILAQHRRCDGRANRTQVSQVPL